ncbi:domain of Kin17 curved DNA-binding protein-domain-containing protein [Aspergillus pseudodeflectus]|uniref:Domain of Kin17 curved DNA-binding protein-domain-containing protein n=1 Tax=Aspergillus pseudodeflectus TaxID=176178 RepID=A0ABR4JLN9_9EURO
MPRAEAGSTKAIANKIKAKGLGRLRWYCQACERQMRDENGFKCHVQSESHVRQVLLIGEDPKKYIEDYSKQFISNFLTLLRSTHGEKKTHINQFYQQVIADKEHIHMNATKWKSLSQFAAHLGREGLCHVEETEKGLFVSYIDRSPDAMRRREAIMKKERQDRGDEEREQRQILEQVARARQNVDKEDDDIDPEARNLQRKEGEKVKLNLAFGAKPAQPSPPAQSESPEDAKDKDNSTSVTPETSAAASPAPTQAAPAPKVSMSFGGANSKPKNVFAAAAKKNPLAGKKGPVMVAPKKMTEQERIMKQEMEMMERKRLGGGGMPNPKRPKVS